MAAAEGRKGCMLASLGVLLLNGAAHANPSFVDVTDAAGVSYLQYDAPEPPGCIYFDGIFCEPERMSGGVAVADVDRDGYPDLFVTRLDASDILFRNRGDGTFEDATAAAGLAGFVLQSNGAVFGDIDNDGDADLLVTVLGEMGDPINNRNYLFINDGSGHFSEEAVLRGADDTTGLHRAQWSASFGDYDRDGYLDLHTTEWVFGNHSRLLRNLGKQAPGHFEDVTLAAGVEISSVDGFASTFVDLDQDGWQDLAVAADFGTSQLFWNNGDGTFTNGTVAAGVGTDENGMGSTFGDFDLDGDLDWFVTSIRDEDEICEIENCNWGYTGNRLYRNEGGRVFSDATDDAGVRDGFWGWGTNFFDADNDGDLDLAMTNGVDFPSVEFDAPFNDDPMRLWLNDGSGGMTEASQAAGLTDTGTGTGLLTFDYDKDGDLDVFVSNTAGAPRLYRNDSTHPNDWLRVRVVGRRSNRDANGARVKLWTRPWLPPQIREVGVASHFAGQSERELHFGLGPGVRRVARLEVEFPASGRVAVRRWVQVNQTVFVFEPRRDCGASGLEILLCLALLRLGRRISTKR